MIFHRIDDFGALSFFLHAKMTAFGLGFQQAWRFFATELAMSALCIPCPPPPPELLGLARSGDHLLLDSDCLALAASAGKPAPPDLRLGLSPLRPGAMVQSVGHLTWTKEIGKSIYFLHELPFIPGHEANSIKVLQATHKKKKSTGSLGRRTKVSSWKVRLHEHENNPAKTKRLSYEPTVVRSIPAQKAHFHMLSQPVAAHQYIPLIIDGGLGLNNHAIELGAVGEKSVFELCVTQPFTPFQAVGLAVASIFAATK